MTSSTSLNGSRRSMQQFQQLFAQKGNSFFKEFREHKKAAHCLVWAPGNTNKLATGSDDCTARLWTLSSTGVTADAELTGHTERIYQLAFNPTLVRSRAQLATASSDKTVRIWDCRSKKCTHKINTEGENINLCWKRDGTHIVVGNKQDIISVIDLRKHMVVSKVQYPHEVNEVKWDNSGQLLMMCTGLGTVEVNRYHPEVIDNITSSKDSIPWSLVRSICAHTSIIYCIDFDPTGRYFAVGSADALTSIWSLPELICINTISTMEHPVRTVSFSFDGELLAHASEEKKIDICHVETGERIFEYPVTSGVNALSWHPKEYLLAYAKDKEDRPDICIVGIKPTQYL